MGVLRTKQEEFNYKISKLVIWAHENGMPTTRGDAHRDERAFGKWGVKGIECPHCKENIPGYSSAKSVHKYKLAQDLNAQNDAHHVKIHDEWDRMGGAPRIAHDMNHYSFKWEGQW